MEVTKEDAGVALADISRVSKSAERRVFLKGADAIYMVWGAVWMAGFTLQQFFGGRWVAFGQNRVPAECVVWWPLSLLGIIATLVVFKRRVAVRVEGGWRVGALWGVMFAYFYVYAFLVLPLVEEQVLYSAAGLRRMTAAISIVPMLVYVVMGLWGYGNYMIWLGLGVTAATIVGLLAAPSYFYLWLAIFGGGALFATGLVARRQWAKT